MWIFPSNEFFSATLNRLHIRVRGLLLAKYHACLGQVMCVWVLCACTWHIVCACVSVLCVPSYTCVHTVRVDRASNRILQSRELENGQCTECNWKTSTNIDCNSDWMFIEILRDGPAVYANAYGTVSRTQAVCPVCTQCLHRIYINYRVPAQYSSSASILVCVRTFARIAITSVGHFFPQSAVFSRLSVEMEKWPANRVEVKVVESVTLGPVHR